MSYSISFTLYVNTVVAILISCFTASLSS